MIVGQRQKAEAAMRWRVQQRRKARARLVADLERLKGQAKSDGTEVPAHWTGETEGTKI